MTTPFLKWAGGKTQLLPELLSRVPKKFGRYFEPFLGGGALFFELQSENLLSRFEAPVLNDSNVKLIETYRCLRSQSTDVIDYLQILAKKYNRAPEQRYYAERSLFNEGAGNQIDRAARFILLNKTCFNGLYRVNRGGLFNVPWGKKARYEPDVEGLAACAAVLKDVSLMSVDFETSVKQARKGSFVYFDPPYVPASASSNFTAYQKEPFGPNEQERLRNAALTLKSRGVHVLLSNSDTSLVRKLYEAPKREGSRYYFNIESVTARRNINSKGGKRGNVGELLIT